MEHFQQPFKDSNRTAVDEWAASHRHFSGNAEFPQWLDDHTLVYVKKQLQADPCICKERCEYRERRKAAHQRHFTGCIFLLLRNNKIVYAAYEPDIRWSWHNYSVIKWLDLASNEQRTLTRRTQLFAPDISEDGNTIVAVKVEPGTKPELQLLSSADGSLLRSLPNPDTLVLHFSKIRRQQYGDHGRAQQCRRYGAGIGVTFLPAL